MRGLRTIVHTILSNKMLLVGAFTLVVAAVSLSPLAPSAHASGGNDIVGGGIWNRDLGSKCGGDVKTIMDHYWIDCNLTGVVDGRVCRDNNVYVGDKVVARNSTSIGREPIQGSHPISIGGQTYYETSNSQALLSDCLDTWVKLDANGSFKYAIIKACGNPIWTPEPVVVTPPPVQQQTYVYACELATKQIRYVKIEDANSSRYSRNLADCKTTVEVKIDVCRLSDKVTVKINESEFSASLYSKNTEDCKEKPAPLTVCDLTTKQITQIDQKDFDKDRYSTDQSACKETPKGELPQTGMSDSLMGGGIGLGSLIVAGSAYVHSRKDWLSILLKK